jgi:hypothetical protein
MIDVNGANVRCTPLLVPHNIDGRSPLFINMSVNSERCDSDMCMIIA